MSTRFRRWATALLGVVVLVSACSDDDDDNNGPDDELSPAEAAILSDALIASGAVGVEEAAVISVLLANVVEVGGMDVPAPTVIRTEPGLSLSLAPQGGDYEAIAFQLDLSVNGEPEVVIFGLLGWRDIDVEAEEVAEVVFWFIPPGPPPVSATFDTFAFGNYWENSTQSSYEATSGTATMSTASFSTASFDCSGTYQGFPVECTGHDGDMSGSFGFGADLLFGTGSATTTWPNTNFNLPAVGLVVDVTIPTL